jgi:F-type H+-transporting ATPase subunit delta
VSNESRIDAYAHALLGIAVVEGYPAEVEDELFRFARTFEGNDALRNAMVDPGLPVERRQAVVEELMGGKALTVSKALASFIVGAGRSEDLPAIVDRFVELSSEGRQHEVAEVRSAVALNAEQIARLTTALSAATGKKVEVRVVVDEKVLGGIVARVGDTVIDGTVRHRIEQLKEQI